MRSTLNAFLGLLAFLLTLISAGGCERTVQSDKVRVAYVTNGVDPYWTIAETGAKRAAADLGVEVLVEMPSEGIAHQKQILEDLMTRGVQGIAVSPIDHVNQTSLLDQIAAKVPLITHDSDAPLSQRRAFIGMNNYDAGRMAGELVKQAIPDGGKVLLFIGRLEQDNGRLRSQGVIDELLGRSRDQNRRDLPTEPVRVGKFEVLGVRTDQFDKSTAKANAADALTAHPDLACMVGLYAYNTPAILEALRQAGQLGKVAVVGFDEQEATLQGVADGHAFGTVVQDPYEYGYRSVAVLKALAAGDASAIPADKWIQIPAKKVLRGDVETFRADMKKKLAGK